MTEFEVENILFEMMQSDKPHKIRLDAVKFYLSNKGIMTGYAKVIQKDVTETPLEKPDLSKLTIEELNDLIRINTKIF